MHTNAMLPVGQRRELAEHETSLAHHEIRIPGIDRISTDLYLANGPFLLRRLMLRSAMDTLLGDDVYRRP